MDMANTPANSATPEIAAASTLDCGVIGNCAFSALVDRMGRMVWCCLPRFDGDPVFNALIDGSDNGSLWSIEVDNFARSEQFYEPNTAVLITRLFDTKGLSLIHI